MHTFTSGSRWLTLVLCLSMAVVLLTGCGSEEPATSTPTSSPTSTETTQPTAAAMSTSPPTQAPVEVGHEVGQKAPDFMLTTAEGDQVTLNSFQGQPVVLYFYATW